jgi:hypothetical protein
MKIINNENERRVRVLITIPRGKKYDGMAYAKKHGYKSFSVFLETVMDKEMKEKP